MGFGIKGLADPYPTTIGGSLDYIIIMGEMNH